MLRIVVLLNTSYTSESDIEDISDDCIAEFVNEKNFHSYSDFFLKLTTHVLKLLIGRTEKTFTLSN